MANLNDLPLNAEEIKEVDVENVPQFGGGASPVPQPGRYVMRLPSSEAIFECFELDNSDPNQGTRLKAIFAGAASLFNVTLQQYYDARISNKVRAIKRKNKSGEEEMMYVSEMAQLLNAVGAIPEGKTNTAYGAALTQAGGRSFLLEHTITASCNKGRDVYKAGKVIAGVKGCGAQYATESYQKKDGTVVRLIPQVDGKFALRFECECGAELRCWSQIRGFGKV